MHIQWTFFAGFYVGMFVCTFGVLLVRSGAPQGYEDLCTYVGASMLWFITWPSDIYVLARDWSWRRACEKKQRIAELRWSIESLGTADHDEAAARSLNEQYGIECEHHAVFDDCVHKAQQREELLKFMERKHG